MTVGRVIDRIIAGSIRHRVAVIVATLALAASGIWAFATLITDAFPDLAPNAVIVMTKVPGLSPMETEQQISYPVEVAMRSLPRTHGVRSNSKAGLSVVTVTFGEDVDLHIARAEVQKRMQDAMGQLPEGAEVVIGPPGALGEAQRLDEVKPLLQKGVHVRPFHDQGLVEARNTSTGFRNLTEGALLVIAVLFLFLRSTHASLLTASVIPLSLIVAVLAMKAFGPSADAMSLGALDCGLIVGASVVMVENIVRKLALKRGPDVDRQAIIRRAACEVGRPIVFGVAIILAVYIPILTLQGLEGRMFRPMVFTVCAAIIGSLVLTLTYVPAAASYVFARKEAGANSEGNEVREDAAWFRWVHTHYGRALAWTLLRRARMIGVVLGLLALSLASVPFLRTASMSRLDEGVTLIETRRIPSASLPQGVAVLSEDGRKLRNSVRGHDPGPFETQPRSTKRLALSVPLVLLLIGGLLNANFGTVRHALLVMLNMPFALIGGIGALWLRGINLELNASVGLIALFGVAVFNGVVLITYINQLREQGCSLGDAVREGASTRLRPMLMTAIAASAGFIPMAISTSGGAEVQRPLATVVIGGLISATLLTLLVLPTVYAWMENHVARRVASRYAPGSEPVVLEGMS